MSLPKIHLWPAFLYTLNGNVNVMVINAHVDLDCEYIQPLF